MNSFKIKNYKLKIVFMGTPEIGALLFEQLICTGFDFSGCITRPDKPKGRGKEIAISPVKEVAQKYNIPTFQPKNKDELTQTIKKIKPDMVIVGAFGMIIPEEAINIPKYQMINFHPSLLPIYRGPSPITAPIVNGDKETGVTIMLISAGMDEGDILGQKNLNLNGDEKISDLSEKLATIGSEMLSEIIPKWIDKKIKPIKQNYDKASYTKMIKKEDGKINFKIKSSEDIERMSRAYYPWPGTYTFWNNKKIDLYDILKTNEKFESGKVIFKENKIYIGTQNGSIIPQSIKIEGKNKVTAEDFIRGYPDFNNSKLN